MGRQVNDKAIKKRTTWKERQKHKGTDRHIDRQKDKGREGETDRREKRS